MRKRPRSLIAIALLGVTVLASWRFRRKTVRRDALLNSAAIDRWEDEGGSALKSGKTTNQAH